MKRTQKVKLVDIWYRPAYFERHSIPDPDSDCIIWNGPLHKQGYGWVGCWTLDGQKKMTTTHRIAARQKFQRALTPQDCVIHTCARPACVNPDHMEIGDNLLVRRRMVERGTYRPGGRPLKNPPKK